MQYDTQLNNHGLKYNPFKALITPRPIGWISTISKTGVLNLAPYSFFNAVSDRPPLNNIEETGEFVCSMVSSELRDAMNMSSAAVNHDIDEFKLAGVTPADSFYVKPPRVGEAPAALECRYWKTLPLPAPEGHPELAYWLVFGEVVGIYIDDNYIKDGIFDVAAAQPLARLGYMDYSFVTAETMFTLNRPEVENNGTTATLIPGPWDGIFR
jgi:flavin reductase (DIM6/NTAB) family NADH-FMN oxidoreductase RutF